ncbi:MAG: hypothetical protein PHR35_05870 [Kiritimatiellae bacterium]|nr:hypothetical protein [Kiritimatiellia bacterium]
MSARIRRGTLKVSGSDVADVANFDWNDADEFDRSKGDEEMSGTPVHMSQAGSGSFTLLSGYVATGYKTAMVLTYNEISVAAGEETPVVKTATFTKVTVNAGGSVPAEGRGEMRVSFDYATCTVATGS